MVFGAKCEKNNKIIVFSEAWHPTTDKTVLGQDTSVIMNQGVAMKEQVRYKHSKIFRIRKGFKIVFQ